MRKRRDKDQGTQVLRDWWSDPDLPDPDLPGLTPTSPCQLFSYISFHDGESQRSAG